MPKIKFLQAEWRDLLMLNYEVDPEILKPYIPAYTELDLWEGKALVSMVGFMFLNTRVLGVKWPFHINFEEVNLRFYVKRKEGDIWKRGVVFIKEIVPKFALSVVANTIYNENYETMPMTHSWTETEDDRTVEYRWRCKNEWQSFSVNANKGLSEIAAGSETEFITEHYWGYARYSDKKTNEYEVRHPKWAQYKVNSYHIAVDFGLTYGENFRFLNNEQPISVMLAEGSDISVEGKSVIYKED